MDGYEWRQGLGVGDDEICVWVGNLGRYNEGALQGGWITLPVEPDQLDRFLREVVGLETDSHEAYLAGLRGERVYEEYFIADYEYAGLLAELGYQPHEYCVLEDLNLLAAVASQQDWDHEAVRAAADEDPSLEGPLGYATLIAESDAIPYFSYSFPGVEDCDYMENEEKLGRTLANEEGLTEELRHLRCEEHFDYESYGRSLAYDYVLCDEGFLDPLQTWPSAEDCDREGLLDLVGWDPCHDPAENERQCESTPHKTRTSEVSHRGR